MMTTRLSETFSEFMPYFGSAKNPIDLTDRRPVSLHAAFGVALSPRIHGMISLYCETALLISRIFSNEETNKQFQAAKKPCFLPCG
jgi:hypothetical protein